MQTKRPLTVLSQGPWNFGAGNEARTRDLNLGKVALYQLSYSRISMKSELVSNNNSSR